MDEDAVGSSGRAWRTDTAERPAVVVPPEPTQPVAPVLPPRGAAPQDRPRTPRPPAPAWIAWAVVAAVLVAAAVIGARLALQPPGDSTTAVDRGPSTRDEGASGADDASSPAAAEEEEPVEEAPEEEPPAQEVAPFGVGPTVTVPGAAPANNDVTGELVTFDAENMLDGDPATCWRIAGNASGSVLTFSYPEEVTVARVGLINGYAKVSVDGSGRSFDWYAGNRRILQVEWIIGGQVFPQTLTETTDVQSIDIEPIAATDIELRIVSVSAPGPQPTGRDYTAISDVAFAGFEG